MDWRPTLCLKHQKNQQFLFSTLLFCRLDFPSQLSKWSALVSAESAEVRQHSFRNFNFLTFVFELNCQSPRACDPGANICSRLRRFERLQVSLNRSKWMDNLATNRGPTAAITRPSKQRVPPKGRVVVRLRLRLRRTRHPSYRKSPHVRMSPSLDWNRSECPRCILYRCRWHGHGHRANRCRNRRLGSWRPPRRCGKRRCCLNPRRSRRDPLCAVPALCSHEH